MVSRRKRPKTLTQLIAGAVQESGLTLTKWCTSNSLNPRLVYRWREGDVERPQMRSIAKLADALGVDYEVAQAAVEAAQKG